jgi:hypothetical protein
LLCVRGFLVVIASILLATTAGAEPPDVTTPVAPRPLFGFDDSDPNRLQKADFSLSLNVTNDKDNGSALERDLFGLLMQPTGLSSGLHGILSYRRKMKRMTVGADTTSTLQHYAQVKDAIGDHGARLTLQVPLRRRIELFASQVLMYSQSYRLLAFPALSTNAAAPVLGSNTGEAVSRLKAYTATTNLGVTQTLSRRSSIDFGYDFQSISFSTGQADLRTWGAGGRFTRRLTRSAVLRFGYGQRLGHYGSFSPMQTTRMHDSGLGIDYERPRRRPTAISVTSGSTIVVGRVLVTGEAVVKQYLGRSWAARMLYRRRPEFVGGFAEPVFLDSATAGLEGFLGRRLELSTSAVYSTGEIGSKATYDSYSGSARASFAMNRHLALSLEYLYYSHRFAGDIITVPAAAALDRHSVRAGVRWWSPLR